MWPFNGRSQRPIPEEAALTLAGDIPDRFKDDGLSLFPDRWFGFRFEWAGRIHDWEYCTRSHPAGSRTVRAKREADQRLGRYISASLPLRWRWLGLVVRFGVWRGGYGSFDSCSFVPKGASDEQLVHGLCRHDIPRPSWLKRMAK